jgi:hypothetical protein
MAFRGGEWGAFVCGHAICMIPSTLVAWLVHTLGHGQSRGMHGITCGELEVHACTLLGRLQLLSASSKVLAEPAQNVSNLVANQLPVKVTKLAEHWQ